MENEWQPISEEKLMDLINKGRQQMSPPERKFWDAIAIFPEKWQLTPYGNPGGGFWVVAVLGKTVVWYNDIESGFNRSHYERYGTILPEEYWCNQDELEMTIRQLIGIVATGENPRGQCGVPIPGEYPPM